MTIRLLPAIEIYTHNYYGCCIQFPRVGVASYVGNCKKLPKEWVFCIQIPTYAREGLCIDRCIM